MTQPQVLELVAEIRRVHDCIHKHAQQSNEKFDDLKSEIHKVDVRVARIEGSQDALSHAAGITTADGQKARKPLLLVNRTTALLTLIGLLVGAAPAYKFVTDIAPAFNQAMLSLAK